ncbi:glycosyl hydrolase family 92-domain-containing protein [Russula compacta]|nr:glycosyl hydrolase family 92-domain-containing protein [Russula compacta]
MPLICSGGFDTCTPNLASRERLRMNHTDDASPVTLNNSIRLSILRQGESPLAYTSFLIPSNADSFACYDLNNGAQKLDQFGVWTADLNGVVARGLGETRLNLSISLIGGVIESGALFSFEEGATQVIIRVGISFVSEEQACANAESEIGTTTFEDIHARSKALWNERLSRIEIDVPRTPPNVTELLYSSLYRASLTPGSRFPILRTEFRFLTCLVSRTMPPRRRKVILPERARFTLIRCIVGCSGRFTLSWLSTLSRSMRRLLIATSTFTVRGVGCRIVVRTTSLAGREVDLCFLPASHVNSPFTRDDGGCVGSSADTIVGHFTISYHNEAAALGIDLEELYAAQTADAEVNPSEWNIQGRQSNIYNHYGYVPYDVLDTSSTGRTTREGSRTLEYGFEDFAIRQVALLLNKTVDEAKYANRSLNYRNVWDPDVTSDGFHGFMQKRFPNGTFAPVDPVACSSNDPQSNTRQCSLQSGNTVGFFESSSWEYSWFVPHDMAHLITLMGENMSNLPLSVKICDANPEPQRTFLKRLDHLFDAGYYLPENEPSFQTPIGYPLRERTRELCRRHSKSCLYKL